MYHVELRQFPHNACHFNLTEAELSGIVFPWAREQWVEFGERKWNPHQATLKIVEGPELPLDRLTMGRGWQLAVRDGADVTERVLEAARAQLAASEQGQAATDAQTAAQAPADASGQDAVDNVGLLADSLGLELLERLDSETVSLCEAWRVASTRLEGRPASESLALAERSVASLLRRRLVVLVPLGGSVDGDGVGAASELAIDLAAEGGGGVAGDRTQGALRAIDSWRSSEESGALGMRRA